MSQPLPAWAREHLEQNLDAGALVNATNIGTRRVLANTRNGAVLVRKAFFGGVTHVVLDRPRALVRFPCSRCGETVQSYNHPPEALSCEGCGAGYVVARDGSVTDSLGIRIRLHRSEAGPGPAAALRSREPPAALRETGVHPAQEESPRPDASADYRPQCSALTSDGAQCRNSARGGSKYCASHKGYQPPGAQQVAQLLDTAPGHEASGDRLLSVRGRAGAIIPGEQCLAVTAAGAQCRNTARSGSKYCPSHRSYQPPAAKAVAARRDTKPRVPGAPDTLPSVRRRAAN